MSRTGKVRTFFGDADREFRLGVGECEELDDLYQLGLTELQEAIVMLRVPVIRSVLRIGLVGAGMDKEKAARLVDRHVRDGYFLKAGEVAMKVVEAAAKGAPDDVPRVETPEGEPEGEGSSILSPTAASDTASSTPP